MATPEPRPGPTQQPDGWQVELLDEFGEAVGDPVRADRPPVRVHEQRPVEVVAAVVASLLFRPVPAEQVGGELVEREQPDAGHGFGWADVVDAVDEDDLFPHVQLLAGGVEVGAAQGGGFAAA